MSNAALSAAADPAGTDAFAQAVDHLASTPGTDEARHAAVLPLFLRAAQSPYAYLRAAASLCAGYFLLMRGSHERAAEMYLRAVECGPRAFGYREDEGRSFTAFPFTDDPVASVAHNLCIFVSAFKIPATTAVHPRIVAWMEGEGRRSECPKWRAIALCYHGVHAITAGGRDAGRTACADWTEASAIPDAELAGGLALQAKRVSAHNLQSLAAPGAPGAPGSPSMTAELLASFRDHEGGRFNVAYVRTCATCHGTTGLRKCSGCHKTEYCGPACQRAHWRTHKSACQQTEW